MSERAQTQISCPACGLSVPSGYPRCPKCHGAMPDAPPRGGDAAAERVQGGTSVAEESNTAWLVGGVALVAAAVIAMVVMSFRGGEQTQQPVVAKADVVAGVDDLVAPSPAAGAPGVRAAAGGDDPPVADEALPQADRVLAAARALSASLEGERLWSTVEPEAQGLAVRSAYCADEGMSTAIERLAETLAQGGVSRVTCYERHGPQVFVRELSAAGAADPSQ